MLLSKFHQISIHTSAREVTINHHFAFTRKRFQSTLPQGKWRFWTSAPARFRLFQSTLPQGKWLIFLNCCPVSYIFQSTLPQGKWLIFCHKNHPPCNFNPHFRKGSDADCIGARLTVTDFNPHFRKGSDLAFSELDVVNMLFQSTLPQGKWHMDCGKLGGGNIFQSTLPQGKWRHSYQIANGADLFQSTLPQGKYNGLIN